MSSFRLVQHRAAETSQAQAEDGSAVDLHPALLERVI
jgi:hypothetical protein